MMSTSSETHSLFVYYCQLNVTKKSEYTQYRTRKISMTNQYSSTQISVAISCHHVFLNSENLSVYSMLETIYSYSTPVQSISLLIWCSIWFLFSYFLCYLHSIINQYCVHSAQFFWSQSDYLWHWLYCFC